MTRPIKAGFDACATGSADADRCGPGHVFPLMPPSLSRLPGFVALVGAIAVSVCLSVACSDDKPEPQAARQTETEAAQSPTLQQQPQRNAPVEPRSANQTESQQERQPEATQQSESAEDSVDPAPGFVEPRYAGGDLTPAAYDADYALRIIDHLTNVIGPRVANSGSDLEAALYLAATFRSLGYETELASFSYTPGAVFTSIDIDGETIASGLLMEGAEPESVQGMLVNVPGVGTVDDFASVDVAGKIAIVDRGTLFFTAKAENALAAGASALIVVNSDDAPFVGTLEPPVGLPVVAVSGWEGLLLRERLGAHVDLVAGEATQSSMNVVARKPDGECRIVVGGHYDTVPSVVGANDNASGTAITVALARAWADADSARFVCFVAFGAEELGLHGSRAFVAELRQRDQLSQVASMLNLDAIGDGNPPLMFVGSPILQDQALYLAEQLGIPARRGALPTSVGSDHLAFANAGIDVIFPIYRGAILHVPNDNFDNLDRQLTAEAGQVAHAILACLLYEIGAAITPQTFCSEDHAREAPPTLNHAEAAAAVVKLAETLGPRPADTSEEVAAAEYIAAVLRSYGYEARLQPFEYSAEYSYAQIFLSDNQDVVASSFHNSGVQATSGRLLRIDRDGSAADYERLDASGAVVIVDLGGVTFAEKAQQAVNAGAVALIIVNDDHTWLMGDLADYRSPIPVLGVPRAVGLALAHRAPQSITISPSQAEFSRSQNVIAKRSDAICSVIVGAHYDTLYRTAGYNDNSSGTALMLEFARIYADRPAADHLCFVGFGAKEVGLHGSQEYARQLQDSGQIANVRYMLNLDAIGSGNTRLRLVVGGEELRPIILRLAEQLGTQVERLERAAWADDLPFRQAGVASFLPLPVGGLMNTIADDANNFDAAVFSEVARISEHALQCMLERAGAQIRPVLDCNDPQ